MFDADQYKRTNRRNRPDHTASWNMTATALSQYATANNLAGTLQLAVAGGTR